VVGLTKATARQELKNLGFTVKIADGVHDNTLLRGEIVSTKPGMRNKSPTSCTSELGCAVSSHSAMR